jgi:thymine-DNA glycosylase
MARKDTAARKPKATKSKNVELDVKPKPSTPGPSGDNNVDEKSPSVLEDDSLTIGNSTTAKQHVNLIEADPPPSTGGQSKRKRVAEKPASESSSSKKPRPKKGYAPPSTYAHLQGLTDTITPNLICLLVGLNPGIQTATMGHPYAHPTNHFWRLLHSSGLTPNRQLAPSEYIILPEEYSLGNTNIVDRATRNGAELSKEEMVAGAGVLEEKIRKAKPEVVCFVGKSIWEAVWKWKHGRKINASEFKYGFQDTKENIGKSGKVSRTKETSLIMLRSQQLNSGGSPVMFPKPRSLLQNVLGKCITIIPRSFYSSKFSKILIDGSHMT